MTASDYNRDDLIRENERLRRSLRELEERLRPGANVDAEAFRAWADCAPVGIFLLRVDRFIYTNPAFVALVGVEPSELLARPCWELTHSEASDNIRKRLADRQAGLEVEPTFRLRLRDNAGQFKWVASHETMVTFQGAPTVLGYTWDVTDWVESEQLLDAEKEKYRTVIESAGEAIFTVDRHGIFIFMNWETARQLGGKPQDFIGRSQWDIFPQDIADRQMRAIRAVFDSGEGFSREVPTVMPAGPRFHHTTGVPVRDVDGEIVSVLCIARDVTDLVQAREALRESETRYARLLENLPVGVFQLSVDGRLAGANDALIRMYGFDTLDECLNAPAEAHIVDVSQWKAIDRALDETGHARDIEVEVRHRNGSPFWVSVTARIRTDHQGRKVGVDGVEIDITARKLAELKFEKLFRHNPALMALSTFPDNRFVDVNDAFLASLGYTTEEVIGKTPGEMNLFPNLDFQAEAARDHIIAGGRIQDVELQVRRKDGVLLDGLFSGDVIVSHGQRYFLTLMVDITGRKKAEEALHLRSLALDQIVDHVTITGLDGKIVFVNRAVAETHGRSKAELIGQLTTAYGEDSRKGATQREILEKTIRDGQWRGEVVNYAGDGNELTMDCRTKVVQDEKGNPIALCGIATNITDRKRAQLALAESESKHRHLFENAQIGMFRTSLDGRKIIDANRCMAETFGYTLDEVFQRTVLDMWFDESQRQAFVKALQEMGEVTDFEFLVRTKSGEPRTALVSARLYGDEIEGSVIDITERARAEQALAESEQLFRDLAESSPAVIIITQGDKIIYANHLVYEIFGLKPSDLETLNFWELMAPDFQDKVRQFGLARQSGEPVPDSYEVRVVTHEGEEKWALFTGRRISYKGKPAGLGLAVDITERKRMEEVLRKSEANLSAILENTTDYILLSDETDSPIYFNSAYARIMKEMLGIDMKPGLKPRTLLPDKAERELWEECHRRVLSGERFTTESVFRPEGLPLRYFEHSFYPIKEDGRVKGFSEVTREITDRKKAEEALRESEERFRRIAERSFDAIFLVDMDGTLKYASPAVTQIGGYSPDQVVGRHLSEFIAMPYMGAVGRGLARLASGQPVENLQFEVIATDGRSRYVEANAVPIMKDTRVVAFQALVRDITERRRAEELLQHAYDEQSRQLRQVAGGLAHDVYNDLFPVSVSLYRLRQRLEKSHDADIERNLKLLTLSEDAISRAISLTESVNLYSKMQKDKVGACADLAAVTRSVIDHNSERIGRSGVRVSSSVADRLLVGCAEHQLHPLLNNLLLNALDALEGVKEPVIEITARAEEGRVRIEFSDNGSGIPADVLPRIFEPFFSTKPHTGTGLGLAIVKRIVDICGGRITVQSALDNGTTFSILLPTDVGTSSGATK